MLANPVDTSSAENALRKPQISIEFEAAAGGLSGGLADSLAAFSGAGDPWLDNLVSLDTGASMTVGADYVHLLYSWSDALAVDVGKEGEIGFGYDDGDTETVMKGQVHKFRHGINGMTEITLCNGGAALAKLRVNQAFEQQTAGDVVTDLAGRAGVDIDTAEAGIDLAYYVVDDRSSVADHLMSLALACGFICYINPGNALYFGPASQSQAVKTFTYGSNLLQAWTQHSKLPVSAFRAVGEGAAGSDGQDAWCWLAKQRDSVATDVGDGNAGRIMSSGAWRNSAASSSAANGYLASAQKFALTGRLLAFGSAEVTVGSVINIADAPQQDINGEFLVTAVKHHYSKARGFLSEVTFCENSAGGLSTLGGLI